MSGAPNAVIHPTGSVPQYRGLWLLVGSCSCPLVKRTRSAEDRFLSHFAHPKFGSLQRLTVEVWPSAENLRKTILFSVFVCYCCRADAKCATTPTPPTRVTAHALACWHCFVQYRDQVTRTKTPLKPTGATALLFKYANNTHLRQRKGPSNPNALTVTKSEYVNSFVA